MCVCFTNNGGERLTIDVGGGQPGMVEHLLDVEPRLFLAEELRRKEAKRSAHPLNEVHARRTEPRREGELVVPNVLLYLVSLSIPEGRSAGAEFVRQNSQTPQVGLPENKSPRAHFKLV